MARATKTLTYLDLSKTFYSRSGYLYTAQDSLEAWYEFETGALGTDSSPLGRDGTATNITATSDIPYILESSTKRLPFASARTAGDFNGSSSELLLTSATMSDLYSQTSLSFSFWINLDQLAGTKTLLRMGATRGMDVWFEYASGNYRLNIDDDAWSTTAGGWQLDNVLLKDTWQHFVITYDRSTAGNVPKAYMDGIELTPDFTTASAGTKQDFAGNTGFGSSTSAYYYNGSLDSCAIWSTILSQENILAIYNSRRGTYGQMQSGILSLPSRVVLQNRDVRTGSYPTIARTGDPDFTGIYVSPFNDTNSIIFSASNNIVYPTGLFEGSKFVSGGVATPNILQGLIAAGTSSAGVSDTHVSFTPGESISPFVENRVYIDNDLKFYTTGTTPGTLPGFNQRLSSKTILTFDTSPRKSTSIFWSTGTDAGSQPYANSALGLAGDINSGLAYYNWDRKVWEIVGNLTTGSNVDYYHPSPTVFTGSMLAQCQNPGTIHIGAPTQFGAFITSSYLMGCPTSVAGFPVESKFNATGSQILSLTSSLTAPFLLEKVSLLIGSATARFGSAPGGLDPYAFNQTAASSYQPPQNACFVLMHEDGAKVDLVKTNTWSRGGAAGSTAYEFTGESVFNVTRDREIIWFARAGCFDETAAPAGTPVAINPNVEAYLSATWPTIYASAETWLPTVTELYRYLGFRGSYTGSIMLEAEPRIIPDSTRAFPPIGLFNMYARNTTGHGASYIGNSTCTEMSGRNLFNDASGRSFIKSIVGSAIAFTTGVNWFAANPTSWYNMVSRKGSFETSPYVLTPKSNLILAAIYQNQAGMEALMVSGAYALNILPGESRLTLFGSQLRNNLPVETTTNQPLTSDAVHEALYFDNPVLDQFDVNSFRSLTGSYVDNVVSGSMFVAYDGNILRTKYSRRVVNTVSSGQAGTTGSLQRFVRLTDQAGTLYDSYPPNPVDILNKAGRGFFQITGVYLLGIATPDQTITKGFDESWFLRTAYEISSTRFVATNFSSLRSLAYDSSNNPTAAEVYLTYPDTVWVATGMGGGSDTDAISGIVSSDHGSALGDGAHINTVKTLFGFGAAKYDAPGYESGPDGADYNIPIIRGYKYGLSGLFGSHLDARFRRDRYGQFRDMLEQRRHPATLLRGGTVEYPLEIVFKSREGRGTDPSKTHSQNLSPFSSSSKPYYDGETVDRSDNPDRVLVPIDIDITLT